MADAVNLEVKKLMVEVDVIEDAKLKQANGESKVAFLSSKNEDLNNEIYLLSLRS